MRVPSGTPSSDITRSISEPLRKPMRADVCLLRGNSPCVRSPSALPTARSQPNQPGFPAPVARWRPCSSFPPPFPPSPRIAALVAAHAGSEMMVLGAWLLGGAVSLIGALCYAELVTAYPHAGGDYHFLTRAFGKRLAFLFAWARMLVMQTGSIALLAFVFGDYASQLFRLGTASSAIYAVAVVAALTGLNVLGVRHGRRTQNLLTVAEVLGVLLVIGVGFAFAAPAPPLLPTAAVGSSSASPALSGSLGMVMIFVLLTYGGWVVY